MNQPKPKPKPLDGLYSVVCDSKCYRGKDGRVTVRSVEDRSHRKAAKQVARMIGLVETGEDNRVGGGR